ncbi:MAG: hypothetical protein EVJ47_04050 [Candidatus Acidulodesulfobacterium ferriphilum]|uniref:Uncharacterized protein n=1 Tax=Candidatus Acidulodesulfobacterium ferriphilum TaxID=2597223 RepID=A0A519BDW8_9DELT|nr:MAG: hypothetical protein EVJ47_04050 [Candidatus Acidulodesulfobacterium ferriphilum]
MYNYLMKRVIKNKEKSKKFDELTQKERVLELVKSGKSDNVADISSVLNISKMSVYRYIRALIDEGKISKTFNKLYPYAAQTQADKSPAIRKCVICLKHITDERLAVAVNQKNGQVHEFCCAHCAVLGVLHIIGDLNAVNSIMGRDFLYGNPLDLRNAFLLFKTDVIPCCSPPILVFARQDDAERFKKGFGGEIVSFDEIISHMKF